jgi:CheY-like chemotaxis protein/two-component sensor histidine kinase
MKRTNETGLSLSARLLQAQDEERRRISRELHDSVGQSLMALLMNLEVLAKSTADNLQQEKLRDSIDLANEVTREIRTVSYLLHPPMLDMAGLGPAISWYAEGFKKRGGINLEVDACDLPRLTRDRETALFRVVQECLTNIHRYSGASTAWIRIGLKAGELHLEVEDNGKGIATADLAPHGEFSLGVGIPGMRERLRELGGSLQIQSSNLGTKVIAILPITAERISEPEPASTVFRMRPKRGMGMYQLSPQIHKRILLADDHEIVRRGIGALIENEPDLEVCGEAADSSQAVEMTQRLRPDLVLLDLSMPGEDGWTAVRKIRQFDFSTKILLFTYRDSPELERAVRAARCEGWVTKSRAASDLIRAIRSILNGDTFFASGTAARTA